MTGKRDERFEEMPEDAEIPVFVISGSDPLCGLVVKLYANRLQQAGEADDELVAAMHEHALHMQTFYNSTVQALVDSVDEEEIAEVLFDELIEIITDTEENERLDVLEAEEERQ